jgi:hypothetical protein
VFTGGYPSPALCIAWRAGRRPHECCPIRMPCAVGNATAKLFTSSWSHHFLLLFSRHPPPHPTPPPRPPAHAHAIHHHRRLPLSSRKSLRIFPVVESGIASWGVISVALWITRKTTLSISMWGKSASACSRLCKKCIVRCTAGPGTDFLPSLSLNQLLLKLKKLVTRSFFSFVYHPKIVRAYHTYPACTLESLITHTHTTPHTHTRDNSTSTSNQYI